jgi:Macrocin-O-methyltransferase (TylF)
VCVILVSVLTLPDFADAFRHENDFYLSSDVSRIGKLLAHYEFFRRTVELPGAIVECGVFKGASLVRWATFRQLFGGAHSKPILGFDVFGHFPETECPADKPVRERFIEAAGNESISVDQLEEVLEQKGVGQNIELVKGDITTTVPKHVEAHPELAVSLLNLDTDIYEPAVTILEQLWPRLVPGGILLLDDFGVFPGETAAVNEFFADRPVKLQKLPFNGTPTFIVK